MKPYWGFLLLVAAMLALSGLVGVIVAPTFTPLLVSGLVCLSGVLLVSYVGEKVNKAALEEERRERSALITRATKNPYKIVHKDG